MKILVDTSIWSLALRKKEKNEHELEIVDTLSELIRDLHVVIIGPIRQEILSGISEIRKFDELRNKISIFPDHEINTEDYELAAMCFNECRKNGIQGSHIDFLICAVAFNNRYSIMTLDNDFTNYQKYTGIKIMEMKNV